MDERRHTTSELKNRKASMCRDGIRKDSGSIAITTHKDVGGAEHMEVCKELLRIAALVWNSNASIGRKTTTEAGQLLSLLF